MEQGVAPISMAIAQNVEYIWTFLLLSCRFTVMMSVIPGLGMGAQGLKIRLPAILVLSYVSVMTGNIAPLPPTHLDVFLGMLSEVLLGAALALVPSMIVAGVQTAGMLSSTTMGLGAGQLLDPTLGINVTSVARIMGDLAIVLFLLMSGHHVIIYAAAGLGGTLVPGTFIVGDNTIGVLIETSAEIFKMGVMVSAPVIVALLLTQFVMGLVSKAVPSVNIFIVSFPLTIGIGLVLTALSFPDLIVYLQRHFVQTEDLILTIAKDAVLRQ